MFNLILVDDEPFVLKGIPRVFDLKKYGFNLVKTYSNPLTALEELLETRPDLIITDVKMPQMDGLRFSQEAKKILPDAEIVILSGHDNFSFAQTAVRLGASDYILKPIKKKDFERMLINEAQNIHKKHSERHMKVQLKETTQLNYSILKNKFFEKLLIQGNLEDKNLKSLYNQLGLAFENSPFVLVKFVIYEINVDTDFMSTLERIISEFIHKFSDISHIEEFYTDEYLYFLMYDFKDIVFEEDDIHRMIHKFADQKAAENIHLLTGVSDIHRDISKISIAAVECDDGILTNHRSHEHHNPQKNPIYAENTDLHIPSSDIESFMLAISTHDSPKMNQLLDQIYEQPAIKLYKDLGSSITLMILLKMTHVQSKYQSTEMFITPDILNIGYLSSQYPNIAQQKKLILEKALKLSSLIESQEIKFSSQIILSAVQYINNHYNENISLTDVANATHISKNYLCDLFKKEMNVTFIDYVTNLRIEKAKYLLSHTDKKMYEISEEVGYNDYAYFSQIFKRHTGTTLSVYRKQH